MLALRTRCGVGAERGRRAVRGPVRRRQEQPQAAGARRPRPQAPAAAARAAAARPPPPAPARADAGRAGAPRGRSSRAPAATRWLAGPARAGPAVGGRGAARCMLRRGRLATRASPEETERAGAALAAALRAGRRRARLGRAGRRQDDVRARRRARARRDRAGDEPDVRGRPPLRARGVAHLDLYRLAGLDDEDPGLLDPYFGPDLVTFVEWPERAGSTRCSASGAIARHVALAHAGGDRRRIEVDVIVLGLDTATTATVAGVLRATGAVVEVRDDPRRASAPGAREPAAGRGRGARSAQAGVGWDEVDRLAVGVGPGELHGAADRDRDGARARAGARAAAGRRELARGARARAPATRAARARRCSTRAAARPSPPRGAAGRSCCPPRRSRRRRSPSGSRALPGTPLAVGDGAVRFRGPLEAAGALVPPDGDGVHRLSAEHDLPAGCGGQPTDRDALLPDYLREPDAVPRQR